MRTKEKHSQVKMNDVITTIGDIIAGTGCRILLHQPKVPTKLVERCKAEKGCKRGK